MALVKNLNGTSERFPQPICKCNTWINHWIVNKNLKPTRCRCCGKITKDLVGGHVVNVYNYDRNYYIVPICRECNKSSRIFKVEETDLVSANCSKCKNK